MSWSLDDCRILDLPKIQDHRGNLTFVENSRQVPFDIKRVYFVYDVPGGAYRAAHAHKQLHQLYVAISGSFDVHLDDGKQQRTFQLNRSHYGLYICPMVRRRIDNFSSNSVLLVLASELYDEEDYIRDRADFERMVARPPSP